MEDASFRRKFLEFLYHEKYPNWASFSEVKKFLQELQEKNFKARVIERNIAYLLERGFIQKNRKGNFRITVEGIGFLE